MHICFLCEMKNHQKLYRDRLHNRDRISIIKILHLAKYCTSFFSEGKMDQ
jgi:hypothetical protein